MEKWKKKMINQIKDKLEDLREALAWKLFPEFAIYIEVAKIVGGNLENERIVKVLEDSDFRYKDGAIKLVKKKYIPVDLDSLFGVLEEDTPQE
jgi:hypothetical protein